MADAKEFSVTDRAAMKAKEFIDKENNNGSAYTGVRIAVVAGGCSGFQYVFNLETASWEGDLVIEYDDLKLYGRDSLKFFIDPRTFEYVKGGTLDYEDGGLSGKSGFTVINNPNAKGGCGCGKSFDA